jgi:hypothetical protein
MRFGGDSDSEVVQTAAMNREICMASKYIVCLRYVEWHCCTLAETRIVPKTNSVIHICVVQEYNSSHSHVTMLGTCYGVKEIVTYESAFDN